MHTDAPPSHHSASPPCPTPTPTQVGAKTPAAPLLAGGVAGVIAYALTYPLDIIKARQQASGGGAPAGGGTAAPAGGVKAAGSGALAAGVGGGGGGGCAHSHAAGPSIAEVVRTLAHEQGRAWARRRQTLCT